MERDRADDTGWGGDAPVLDKVGYHVLDFTSSTHLAVSVRHIDLVQV